MILSLKICSFVYKNISNINSSNKISCVIDFDENEEKKELDENEKIHQPLTATHFNLTKLFSNTSFPSSLELKNLYFEFTTPPPEVII